MTPDTDDALVRRLRDADQNSVQRFWGSDIFGAAAARISSDAEQIARLTAERDEATASSDRICDSYAAENQRLFDRAESAERQIAEMQERAASKVARPPLTTHKFVFNEVRAKTTEGDSEFITLRELERVLVAIAAAIRSLPIGAEKESSNG